MEVKRFFFVVKMNEKALPKGGFFLPEHPQQLPHGLGGIGMGLGPGGQPIDANHLNKGIGMGNLGPAGKKYSVPLDWGFLGKLKLLS